MRTIAIVLGIAVFGFSVNSGANWAQVKKTHVLHVATEGTFRPFNYYEGEALTGFEVELVAELAKRLGVKVEWTVRSFDTLFDGLGRHQFELVAASHAITPERTRVAEFINPHYCSGAIIVTLSGGARTLRALSGKAIGVAVGTTYFDRLRAMPRFKEVKTYADGAAATKALVAGEIAAWVTDRFVASAVVKEQKNSKLELGEVIFPEMIAMAVAKDDAVLKDKINAALAGMMKDGTYQKLSQRYFDQDIRCRDLGRSAHSKLGD